MTDPLFEAVRDAPLGSPERDEALKAYDQSMLDRIGEWEFLTYPVAWAIQRKWGEELEHHPRCSSVSGWDPISGPGLLCDCEAITRKWQEIVATPRLDGSVGDGE